MDTEQYRDHILDQTKDLIWMVDHQLHLVYANKSYFNMMKEVTGVEKELNTPILVDGFGQDDIEKWKGYYERALSGDSFTIEEHFFHPVSKEMRYGHISFLPIKNDKGKVQCVACRNSDVTNIAIEKYQASSLMDASLDVFCTINEAGNFVFVSDASLEHWGYFPKELAGKPYRDLLIEEDLEKTDIAASSIMAGKIYKTFNNRFRNKNGDIAYNLWSARWDDEAKMMYCVARDAKEKIEEEHRLKLLSSVITNSKDAVLIFEAEPQDKPGPRIIYVNEEFTKMTGYSAEEVIGKTPRILQGPKSDKEALAKLGNALRNWEPYEITTINYKKNGEEFWINFTVTPVADETGWYTHWIAIERDVTTQKNQEKQLLSLNDSLQRYAKELERSNEELESFAFITSHDLQEPLRMISSFIDQLDRKYANQLDDKAKQYIHFAKNGAKRMKQIILDLLLYSRVNRPTEQQESVNLNEIVSEFLLLRRKLIAEKKAIINFDQLPVMETYNAPVTQLFHCLLDNALKYSREDVSPVINVQVVDKGEFWEFAIKDNGIGIDEQFYGKVFIIFQRLHNRKKDDGTGIGLSIAKRAVEFLGGEIWVESEIGKGSTFYFTISKTTNHTI